MKSRHAGDSVFESCRLTKKSLTPLKAVLLMAALNVCVIPPLQASGIENNTFSPLENKLTAAPQETKTVKGIVYDEKGETIVGANIVVEGTTIGVTSGYDGDFALEVPEGGKLKISFVGYVTQVLVPDFTQTMKIVLKEESQDLDEVVVVGYGTQKKLNLTGAVSTAKGDVLENRPIGNIAQGLQGVIPNLNITFNSGKPDGATSFNIRGNTSLNGGGALVLVDGVESDISLLNPNDIESVSVLKDAASASIYGARAAFGVVLITTKKGKKNEKMHFSYSNNFSWTSPSNMPDMPRSDRWVDAMNLANRNSVGSNYFGDKFVAAVKAHIQDPVHNPAVILDKEGIGDASHTPANPGWAYVGNTNWFDEAYQTAFMQQHNASISGGTEKSSYYASMGYKGQDGLFRYGTDKYERVNLSFNFQTAVTDWLDLKFLTKYNHTETNEPNITGGDVYYEIYRMFPTLSMYLPDGNLAGIDGANFNRNFVAQMAATGRVKNKRDDYWLTGGFVLKPIKGLTINGDYTMNKYYRNIKQHNKTIYQVMPENVAPLVWQSPNGVTQVRNNDVYQAVNIYGDYKFSLADHNFSVMLGYNQEKKQTGEISVTNNNLVLNDFPISDWTEIFQSVGETATQWAVQGGFFRLNYDYAGKYLLELNGRYDGSSKYASEDRWGFFPSGSVGWRMSEEKFFTPLKKVVTNLKLRYSVGLLGNQVTDGNFDYMGMLSGETLSYLMGGGIINGLKAPSLANSNITWEKVLHHNAGIDLGFFNNRLTATFEYYLRYTKDMVRQKSYPAVLGTSGGKENVADMRTNGWELSLSWNDKIENVAGSPLNYSLTVGLYDSYSTITKYDNPTGTLSTYYKGQKLGEIWGYVTDGFIRDQAEADRMKTVQSDIDKVWLVGDIRYRDLDGDGEITYGENTLAKPGDKKIIGNSTPRYRFNIQGGLNWKGFDVRVLFEGTAKRDYWLNSTVFWGYQTGIWWANINQYHIDHSWSENNTNAYFPVPSWSDRSRQTQTKYLQNAAYIRLKDLTVSYSLPKSWISKLQLEQVRVFFSGQNLWEASGLKPYLNVDMVDAKNSSGYATDGKIYPFSRTLSCGLNITF